MVGLWGRGESVGARAEVCGWVHAQLRTWERSRVGCDVWHAPVSRTVEGICPHFGLIHARVDHMLVDGGLLLCCACCRLVCGRRWRSSSHMSSLPSSLCVTTHTHTHTGAPGCVCESDDQLCAHCRWCLGRSRCAQARCVWNKRSDGTKIIRRI